MNGLRLASVIERRLLVNYRIDPEIAAGLLPAGLRPQLVRGHAVGGICLLRLGGVRPAWAPKSVGLGSENAAHRFAVEWDGPDGVETGVYIPRRDTGSRLNAWAGGRLFPGEHGLAAFEAREVEGVLRVAYATHDGSVRVDATVEPAEEVEDSRLFGNLAEASAFFRAGAKGYSATSGGARLDGMQLHTEAWRMDACRIREVRSSYFDDLRRFPSGSIELDSALVMRDVPACWRAVPEPAAS